MKNRVRQLIVVMFMLAGISAKSQSANELFSNSGIWADYGLPVSAKTYPEFSGRLVNVNWSDIELSPNVWDWTMFDNDITLHIADSMPVIFMVYTRMNAPQWLYTNGVPKVSETNSSGVVIGYSPYYLDSDYNFYFKRMITKVRQHVETLQPSIRNKIIGVQACFGSTGDRLQYKGLVAKQYAISDAQFDSLFKVYSLYYYNEYKNVVPKITMMTNANYQDPAQYYWIRENCPGGWMKCPTMNQGYQMNMELDKKAWLYDLINKPQAGDYMKARCEIWSDDHLVAGWWTKNKYKNMFSIMTYCIYWGLDWPNEMYDMIQDPKYDSAFHFFNKYAGQKVPALASNAMCALKDVLDASDTDRFPVATFGTADRLNKTRYTNIYNAYTGYGAKLEDPSVITGSEYDCLLANGTNDVGWRLLPGNYERYLHQIDANITSAGYWNVDDINLDAMYGRFARGFDLNKGKDALYFDLEDGFLKSKPLNGTYPVTIEVTYYDNGTGSWQLYYDAQTNSNKASVNVTCGNTKTWKKTKIVLSDAYFGNRGTRGSDFYIKSTGTANVVFSVVELSRPAQSSAGFVTSPLPSFDTVCLNSVLSPKSFVLNAGYLNGTDVQVGPLNGYTFSKSESGPFSSSLTYSGYGQQINATVYVNVITSAAGVFAGNIPITGGGATSAAVSAKATVMNTSPVLNAVVKNASCYNKYDGAIDLQPTGGLGAFTYKWTNDVQSYWSATTQDLSGLAARNYTVVVNSAAGCSTTKTFTVTQPEKLVPPDGINGPSSVVKQTAGVVFSIVNPKSYFKYIWSVPYDATITSGQNTPSITVKWGNSSGNVMAQSQNSCGNSSGTKKYITATNTLTMAVSNGVQLTDETSKLMNPQMMIMPNPTKDIAMLRFYADKSFTYSVQVADMTGKILLSRKGTAAPGNNVESINVQQFAPGHYFVTLINNRGEKQTLKLVKE